jgi:iron complex transport system substrate-binding protein
MHLRWPLLLAVPFLALAVACSSGGDDEGATQSPTTPTASARTIDVSKDDLGRSVKLPASPQRIVAMSPTAVELLFSVGVTPVGRPSSADFPEAAKTLPNFGASQQPNYEEIAAMRPDLIIADAVLHKDTVSDLERLGAPVWAVRVNGFEDVTAGLRKIGAITGKTEAGEREAKKLEDQLAGILSRKPASAPSVILVVAGGPTQLFAGLDNSYTGDILNVLGARNVLSSAGAPETFRLEGFSDYSIERIVEKNPDVIVAISPGRPGITTQAMASSPVYGSLKAVREGRVHEVDPIVYLQAPGPRVSLMLDELARILYPDVFKTS